MRRVIFVNQTIKIIDVSCHAPPPFENAKTLLKSKLCDSMPCIMPWTFLNLLSKFWETLEK